MCCISQVAVPGTNALGSTDCEGGREVTGQEAKGGLESLEEGRIGKEQHRGPF